MATTIAVIVALIPSSIEKVDPSSRIQPEILLEETLEQTEPILATEVPTDRIPDYSIDGFDYVSSQGSVKQWKLLARKAFLYNRERLVHSRRVTAHLFDTDGKITVVTGLEAKYYMNQKDLEVFGDVVTRFPDGFEVRSAYLRYKPAIRKIEIPLKYRVRGQSGAEDTQTLGFESDGMDFSMEEGLILLPKDAIVRMGSQGRSETDMTEILSDRCVINRRTHIAHFTMDPGRPLKSRFVRIHQPTLSAKSRRADLRYGNDAASMVQYMTAYEDVLIHEKPKEPGAFPRYGTGGRADFDQQKNLIILREFPQVYQDEDTITGDVIIVHRETDIVEVEHSNAYSSGKRD